MPYAIRHLADGGYRVVNTVSGRVHAKHTTKRRAQAQVRLLNAREHGTVAPRGKTHNDGSMSIKIPIGKASR